MLSRVADSIYWMCRYIERAESISRFIDVNLHLMLDLPVNHEQWEPLVITTGDQALFAERYGEPTQRNVIRFLAFDPAYPSSVLSCVRAARENGRSVRDSISSEMWEALNGFYHLVNDANRDSAALEEPHRFFTEVRRASHLFKGVTDSTMTRSEGWHFARMGRLLERADKTSRILDVKYYILLPRTVDVGAPYDNIQWAALLKSASALEMYRKRFGRIAPSNVAAFLLFDREFPRAIHYSLIYAENSLHAITGSPWGSFQNEAEMHLGRLRSELDYTRIDDVISSGLHEYLDNLQGRLNAVGDAIFNTFFALRPAPAGDARGQAQFA
ncbi:MAG: alpha-E domain-containing protein [Candidatus Methylomirabilis sp.]|nr:alpha-E domain-containing protein [Deltaproteobacteria bacterium]